jgi:hypothetical protein
VTHIAVGVELDGGLVPIVCCDGLAGICEVVEVTRPLATGQTHGMPPSTARSRGLWSLVTAARDALPG